MSIRRRKKTKAFTQINNSAIRNRLLSLKAKGLLIVMMSCPEEWRFYMKWLEKQSRDGREAHQNAMKELEQHRYVIRLRVQRTDGTFRGWEYLVDDEPITDIAPGSTVISDEPDDDPASEISQEPTNGKTVCRSFTDKRENRLTGKPTDGKPATINTEVTNTNQEKNVVASNVTENAHTTSLQRDDCSNFENLASAQLEAAQAFGLNTPEVPDTKPNVMDLHQEIPLADSTDLPENSNVTAFENIPPAAPSAAWDPAEVDTRLDQLCNGRWLSPYVLRGKEGQQRPLITEVDSSGVDRHDIARRVSPAILEEVVLSVRQERGRLQATTALDPRVRIFSAQHLMIQELQKRTLASYHVEHLVQESVTAAAECQEPGSSTASLGHDPCLSVDQRCMVGEDLGVILSVTNAAYIVELDNGERITVDRAVAVQLRSLKTSDVPAPERQPQKDEPFMLAPVGSQWTSQAGGETIVVEAVNGILRQLSNGQTLPCYLLKTKYQLLSEGAL